MRLTKRAVDQLQWAGADRDHYDEVLKGFGVRVRASGRKSYFVMTRIRGRMRRFTLGTYGVITAEEARNRARVLLGEISAGEEPVNERARPPEGSTVQALAERFVTDYASIRVKASTASEYRRAINAFVLPKIGTLQISDIDRPKIAALHHGLRETPYQANRTLAILSVMFAQAELWGLRAEGTNPCRGVRKFKEGRRERFLSDAEIERLGASLATEYIDAPYAVHCIRLLLLTGCRLGEIQTLEWRFVDLDRRMIHLPDSKTGKKTIYLGAAVSEELSRISQIDGNPYVIAGDVEGQYIVNMQKPWRRIRARAGLDDVRIHDLRHTFASSAIGLGEGLPVIGKLLGHSQTQTTARYAHIAETYARLAAEKVSAAIAERLAIQ